MNKIPLPFRKQAPIRSIAAATAMAITMTAAMCMQTAAHAAPACTQSSLPPMSTEEQLQQQATWGIWRPYESRFVRLDKARAPTPTYHVLMKRKPGPIDTSRPVVLFLHGVPEFARSWENWMDLIGEHYDVIAIDFKGFGESSRPTEIAAYDVFRSTGEINDVVACLGYQKVIPVGHDWGGAVAWLYSIFFPMKTQAVVVLSTPHPYTYFRELAKPDSEQRRRSVYIDLIRQNTPEATAQFRALMDPYVNELLEPYYTGLRGVRLLDTNMKTDWHWDRMLSLYRAMSYPPSPWLYPDRANFVMKTVLKVRVPALAFYGEDDPLFAIESWRDVEAFVPNLTFEVLPGQRHFINHSAPELPAKTLAFIRRHAP